MKEAQEPDRSLQKSMLTAVHVKKALKGLAEHMNTQVQYVPTMKLISLKGQFNIRLPYK